MCALLHRPPEITPFIAHGSYPYKGGTLLWFLFSNMYTYVSISSCIISHVLFFARLKGIANVESLVEVHLL
jgi:hypothetical protein